jgi:hypothetical protein
VVVVIVTVAVAMARLDVVYSDAAHSLNSFLHVAWPIHGQA